MLKAYRKGFVTSYMTTIGLVLLIVVSAVGILMHRNAQTELRNTMRHVVAQMKTQEDSVPAMRPDKKPGGDHPPRETDENAPQDDDRYDMPDEPPRERETQPLDVDADSIVTVLYDRRTQTVTFLAEGTDDSDAETVTLAAQEIEQQSADFGRLRAYRLFYYKDSTPDVCYIALAASSYIGAKDLVHLLLLALLYLASMGVFLLLSRRLSFVASKPMENAIRMERQFVTDISHDLKTPITVILANCNILRSDPTSTIAEQTQWIDSTDAAATDMMQLVQQMLALSALESGSQTVELQPVDLSSVAEKCVLQLESIAYDRSITVESDIAAGLSVPAAGDYAERICTGLLENALKYEPDGGSVFLTLKSDRKTVVLSVGNRGSVIDPADLPHIFERFYRADKTRNIHSGHGLGLSILKQIAELLHADMDVRSSSEEGTVFTVRFRPGAVKN